jgi:uncharacterized protein YwqG
MDLLKEQAIACIRQGWLDSVADGLIGLLRNAICLKLNAVAEQFLELGASKVGGRPDLPVDMEWPNRKGAPLPFYAQIHCADLVAVDQQALLPHTGWLYFFYDVLGDLSSPRQNRADTWRVLYVPGETVTLRRSSAPDLLDEWEQYESCAIHFSPGIMLPAFGSRALESCGLSYSTFSGSAAEQEYYLRLLDQLGKLSGSDDRKGLHLLGYPDDFGPERDAEWILLFQIDTNCAALQGVTKMAKGDWLAISFWIPQDALARGDFDRVEILLTGD